MTIREIAELSGVSTATVSRVFSHHPSIRPDVRSRVMDAARQNGYHPRFSSRQKNVVILTPYNSDFPVQSCVDMILHSLVRVLPERGFRVEILPVNNAERLDQIQFCGAVAIGGELADFPRWSERFTSPLVIMDRPSPARRKAGVAFVHSDEAQGMTLAMEEFFRNGHRNIGCIIHGTPERGNALMRRKAIEAVLTRHGITPDASLIQYSGDGSERYVELIGLMLRRGVTALFCPGGNAGIVSLYAATLFNRRIPEDVSLIASEQTAFSRFTVPPQTTISPDYPGLAGTVAELLEEWLESGSLVSEKTLPYQLIARESVAHVG